MWLAALLVVLVLGLAFYVSTKKPKNFPPGPRWWPYFGSAPQIALSIKRTGHLVTATAEMAKKYGPVLGLKVGKEVIVVVHDTQPMKEFLTLDSLAGRPYGEFFDMRSWGKRRGIMLVDEEFWQEQRRFFLRQLREFGFGSRNMSKIIENEAQELVKFIENTINYDDTNIFRVDTLFNVSILNALWKMLAGKRYHANDKEMKELQSILNELLSSLSMMGTTFSYFPILKYLAPQQSGYNLYVMAHLRIWEFLYKELHYHKKTINPDEPRDVMDVYLNLLNSTENLPNSFSEEQLLATCMDMFMAGSETTNNTMGFCFAYLILNPEIQQKAQDEIDAVIGKQRSPTLDDRPNLPYIECIVMESLRMFGGRAFTIAHRALKDTWLNGYLIPKDVLIVGNLHGCMLSRDCGFEDPEVFRPERFLKNNKISLPDNLIPFGVGKRRCMGESLARTNIFLFISTILQNFTFSLVPEHPPSTDWRDGVTPGPIPFKARIKRRY